MQMLVKINFVWFIGVVGIVFFTGICALHDFFSLITTPVYLLDIIVYYLIDKH